MRETKTEQADYTQTWVFKKTKQSIKKLKREGRGTQADIVEEAINDLIKKYGNI